MTDVNKTAETSAVVNAEPAFNPADQHTWSSEQREHWNKTGDIPEAPKKSEPAPTDPPKAAISEGEPKSAAEPEPAKPQEKDKKERKPGEKLSAEERISQLTAEVKLLKERDRERESAAKPTEKTETKAEAEKAPERPNPFKWAGTPEDYDAAVAKYEEYRDQKAIRDFQQRQAQESAQKEMTAKLDDARKRYPDAEERIIPAVNAIISDKQIPNAIKALLDDSDVLPDLMYVLGEPEKLGKFIQSARNTPAQALRELVVLEGLVRTEMAKPKGEASKGEPAKGAAEAESGTKKETPAEEKPRAPKPPSEVGGRGTAPEDALRSAAGANNFREFEAEQTRRMQARLKQ